MNKQLVSEKDAQLENKIQIKKKDSKFPNFFIETKNGKSKNFQFRYHVNLDIIIIFFQIRGGFGLYLTAHGPPFFKTPIAKVLGQTIYY